MRLNTVAPTSSGLLVDFANPRPDQICLTDIVTQLSREGRWANALRYRMTVAQHSCVVCDLCPDIVKPFGLLHDASEAYMRDIPYNLKKLCKEYQIIEKRIQSMIYQKYLGQEWLPDCDRKPLEYADRDSGKTEGSMYHEHYNADWFSPDAQCLSIPALSRDWGETEARNEMWIRLNKLGIHDE